MSKKTSSELIAKSKVRTQTFLLTSRSFCMRIVDTFYNKFGRCKICEDDIGTSSWATIAHVVESHFDVLVELQAVHRAATIKELVENEQDVDIT